MSTSDWKAKAKRALGVYLERGQAALLHLEGGRASDADALLQRRSAAFHNFRAVDALALKEGDDLKSDPEALALWNEIRIVDKALAAALAAARDETANLYLKVREARGKIGKFRSGSAAHPKFEKTA